MTYSVLNYRLNERRTAYANFVAYLEYLTEQQVKNKKARRCIVRIVKVRGSDGELSARDGWRIYCETKPHMIGRDAIGHRHD